MQQQYIMESKTNSEVAGGDLDQTKPDLNGSRSGFTSQLEAEVFLPDLAEDTSAQAWHSQTPADRQPAETPLFRENESNLDLDDEGPGEIVQADPNGIRPEQAEALLTISGLLNSDLNPGRVLRDMLKPIRALFHANRAAVFLREHLPLTSPENAAKNPVGEEFESEIGPVKCAAALGLSPEYLEKISTFYEVKEFRRLQQERRPLYVNDAQHDYRLNGVRELNRREGFQTMLTLPLLHRKLLVGALVLYHDEAHTYSPEEIKLLSIFANQAALAISNARLYNETRNREREAAFLAESSRAFNESLKLRDVMNRVVGASAAVLGNTALIFIVREGSDLAYPVAFYSNIEPPSGLTIPSPVRTQPPTRIGEGAVGKTIQSGTPFFIHNVKDVLKAAPFIRPEDNVEALLCVPLKTRGKTIGALVCYKVFIEEAVTPSKAQHNVTQRQLGLAQALADRASVAIENARMYEAEKREQQNKDEFLSFVAHELRTPLTSIKGYNNLLIKRLQEPGATFQTNPLEYLQSLKRFTGVVETQAERLQSLIQDLTSISRIETGNLEVNLRSVNLVDLVRETVEGVQADLAATHQARLAHEISLRYSRPQIELQLDPDVTKRILRNLMSNAVKFSPKGGNIIIRLNHTPTEVTLSVQDPGIGIRPEDQEQIFERFYKASSQPGRANGLGLGLYITKSLVEAEGGHIQVKSEVGAGSTFTVTFPLPKKLAS